MQRKVSKATKLAKLKESKNASKRVSKNTGPSKGYNKALEPSGKDIGSGLGSQFQEVVRIVKLRGGRVVQRPQRYRE
jgi:hypothetical protein